MGNEDFLAVTRHVVYIHAYICMHVHIVTIFGVRVVEIQREVLEDLLTEEFPE